MSAAPVVSWASCMRLMEWQQGEHVTLVGPTGCGKTTAGLDLLKQRGHSVVIGTKPSGRDSTLTGLLWRRNWHRPFDGPGPRDWRLITRWPPPDGAERVILWPRYRSMQDRVRQRAVIEHALDEMFKAGGWCMFLDETNHLVRRLGLGEELADMLRMGRSNRQSIVTALQRPRYAPLECYDQATHLFLWADNDRDNLKRLGDLGGKVDSQTIRALVTSLNDHECLYLNTRTGSMARTEWSPA